MWTLRVNLILFSNSGIQERSSNFSSSWTWAVQYRTVSPANSGAWGCAASNIRQIFAPNCNNQTKLCHAKQMSEYYFTYFSYGKIQEMNSSSFYFLFLTIFWVLTLRQCPIHGQPSHVITCKYQKKNQLFTYYDADSDVAINHKDLFET